MDVNKLLQALEDETNENLLDFTSNKMKEMNFCSNSLRTRTEESIEQPEAPIWLSSTASTSSCSSKMVNEVGIPFPWVAQLAQKSFRPD